MKNKLYETCLATGTRYYKAESLAVSVYADSLRVTDLTNALRPGATCRTWSFYVDGTHRHSVTPCELVELAANCDTLPQLAVVLRSGQPLLPVDGLTVYQRDEKAMRVYSPFAAVKPIKAPQKWTLPHVWKAILAGQIKAGRVEERLTDDYAFDAATDFGRGPCDVQAFARELIEHPGGWCVYGVQPQQDGTLLLKIACHTFDFRTLVFDPAAGKAAADRPAATAKRASAGPGAVPPAKKPPLRFPDPYKWLNQRKEVNAQ